MESFGENPAGMALTAGNAVHSPLWKSRTRINGKFRRFPPFPAAVEKFGKKVKTPRDVNYPRGFVEKKQGGKGPQTPFFRVSVRHCTGKFCASCLPCARGGAVQGTAEGLTADTAPYVLS